jgi:PI-3-kinase-related kinase SMG-1
MLTDDASIVHNSPCLTCWHVILFRQVCWEPLKKQLALISSALSHTSLELGDVSPALAALKDTHVPMPGLEASHMDASLLLGPATSAAGASAGSEAFGSPRAQRPAPSCGYVTIMGVHPHLTAIPTKTRPKRIVLLGSDGCDHIFLLKGRDDLRMDERLMQIVRVSNRLMAADRPAAGLGLAMRHYSVTPLGDRVGLIQWVENTASLFSLFRSWQSSTRERHAAVIAMQPQAAAAAAAGSGGAGAAAKGQGQAQGSGRPPAASTQAAPLTGVTGAVPPPSALALAPRPIDVFYARLQTALMSAGVPVTAPRRQWPLDVLKKVKRVQYQPLRCTGPSGQ